MEIRTLSDISLETIVACFNAAFADYVVAMPTEVSYWQKRWQAARVKYDLSIGAFEGDNLIGLMIHGIDQRNGLLTAFNAGTGVIPSYRGRRLVKEMYRIAIPIWEAYGVEACTLEVITSNQPAIRAYKSVGMTIKHTLHCFRGDVSMGHDVEVRRHMITNEMLLYNQRDTQYAWDNTNAAILARGQDYYRCEVVVSDQVVGHFLLEPNAGYPAQFEVYEEQNLQHWKSLFSGVGALASTVKINNVYSDQKRRLEVLEALGFEHTIDQFEMSMQV